MDNSEAGADSLKSTVPPSLSRDRKIKMEQTNKIYQKWWATVTFKVTTLPLSLRKKE